MREVPGSSPGLAPFYFFFFASNFRLYFVAFVLDIIFPPVFSTKLLRRSFTTFAKVAALTLPSQTTPAISYQLGIVDSYCVQELSEL